MKADITVGGVVQGVGFRPFVFRKAVLHSLVGGVRNRGDGLVEIVVQGEEAEVRSFLEELRSGKPPLARYDTFEVRFGEDTARLDGFAILESSREKESHGSTIPPDVGICEDCLGEVRDRANRRYGYFFTTCTNCGPRFSIIRGLPYDRRSTTMQEFGLCQSCRREYETPADRRFHAETIACQECGPEVFLADRRGRRIQSDEPIRVAGRGLNEGKLVAVKGIGGFHIACSVRNSEALGRLRKVKHRSQKPFAVMAADIESVMKFAYVSEKEREALTSPERPIVLLTKRGSDDLSEQVSPGLSNVGVMLPYTALHFLLFDSVREAALVMTSANPPGEPLVKDNSEATKALGGTVDYFLMNNREIANRCDDSVIRVNDGVVLQIRRSRGFAPSTIKLKTETKGRVLALGAEFMDTACLLHDRDAFLTQHIGDLESLENYLFLKDSVRHLLDLTNIKPDVIACDLHPTMNTSRLARRMGEELGIEAVQVQHHHAHAASVAAEEGLDSLVAVTCDGFGYGSDGSAWGGEVLLVEGGRFRRAASLEPQPLAGGDAAVLFPLRMAAGILSKSMDVQEFVMNGSDSLPHGEREAEAVLAQLQGRRYPTTTSAGRVLDAASYVLGLCKERTYEGEPAMKLESAARSGKDVLGMEPEIRNGELVTTDLIAELFEQKARLAQPDLAYSAEEYLAKGLAEMALDCAETSGVAEIGFTGGVAYNAHISRVIRGLVEKHSLNFHINRRVPCGDGGISFGQAYVASLRLGQS